MEMQGAECIWCEPWGFTSYTEGMLYQVCLRHMYKPRRYAPPALPPGDQVSWKRGTWNPPETGGAR